MNVRFTVGLSVTEALVSTRWIPLIRTFNIVRTFQISPISHQATHRLQKVCMYVILSGCQGADHRQRDNR